jgi:hypothetical protein
VNLKGDNIATVRKNTRYFNHASREVGGDISI